MIIKDKNWETDECIMCSGLTEDYFMGTEDI